MAEIPDLLRSLIDELDRKGALLLELRQQLTPQRRQEVEKRLRGLARKLCFSFDARIDQVAGFAGKSSHTEAGLWARSWHGNPAHGPVRAPAIQLVQLMAAGPALPLLLRSACTPCMLLKSCNTLR